MLVDPDAMVAGPHVEIWEDEDDAPTQDSAGPICGAEPKPGEGQRFQDHQLAVDRVPRYSFMDRFLGPEATVDNVKRGLFPELGDFVAMPYHLLRTEPQGGVMAIHLARDGYVRSTQKTHSIRIVKQFHFRQDRPAFEVVYELSNRYRETMASRFAVEMNLNLDSARGRAQYLWINHHERVDLHKTGVHQSVMEVMLVDEDRPFQFVLYVRPAANVWHYPIETVRETAGGCESSFQGTCVIFWWPLALWGEEKMTIRITSSLKVGRPSYSARPGRGASVKVT